MPDLKIARDLALPTSAATQTFAILAQRRKGKTYTASVIAEEMVGAGMPWVALDPTGAWWGLRAG
jgi:DNA helicase HerA-like ATPase